MAINRDSPSVKSELSAAHRDSQQFEAEREKEH